MNAKVRKQWTEKLTSGEYKQTTHVLRKFNVGTKQFEYCCLGVLCDISKQGVWTDNGSYDCTEKDEVECERDARDLNLPRAVQRWAGIDDNGTLPDAIAVPDANEDDDWADSLADLNDRGASFEQIASIIEEKLNDAEGE